MPKKYALTSFLTETITQERYERWLYRKAMTHVRRDRKRGNKSATNEKYKIAIHTAVEKSEGRDFYTGEELDWALISTYDNAKSKSGGRKYKAKFALLPSVDHVDDGLGDANFRICAWRTNEAKNDMSLEEFVALCEKVIRHSKLKIST